MKDPVKVFIGSSLEGFNIADHIRRQLHTMHHNIRPDVWKDGGFFSPSKSNLEQLVSSLEKYDFGIFVFSPNDVCKIRGQDHPVIRDNVLFELGMFVGRIGVERNFIIAPNDFDFHIPTDLSGYTMLTYDADWVKEDEYLSSPLGPACSSIAGEIKKLGPISTIAYEYSHSAAICFKDSGEDHKFLLVKSRCGKFRGFPKKRVSTIKDDRETAKDAAHVEGGVIGDIKHELGTYKHFKSREIEVTVNAFSLKVEHDHGSCEGYRKPEWYSFHQAVKEIAKDRSRLYAEEMINLLKKFKLFHEKRAS